MSLIRPLTADRAGPRERPRRRQRRTEGVRPRGLLLILAAVTLVAAGCATESRPALSPSFEPLYLPATGDLMTISSPALADLDGDGTDDIVFGTGIERIRMQGGELIFIGEPEVSGYAVAVSGATNDVLWEVPNPRDAFTTPRFADLTGDGAPDVVMGGREGAMGAFRGDDGTVLWRVDPADVADTRIPYNFFSPAVVEDLDEDGVADLLVTYGGDDLRMPQEERTTGYFALVSGADGRVIAAHETPDGAESYSSPVVYERPDGRQWAIVGTGGETHPGSAFRAPVSSFLDGTFPEVAERLIAPGEGGGVMSPPTLLDLTDDGELDIVLTTFDGRLTALDGASAEPLGEIRRENEETYHPAAVARLPDGGTGLFVSWGQGSFPRYLATVHRLHDAHDGSVLFEYRDENYPAGAPLAVDLTGDGADEILFFTVRYPAQQGARVYLLDVAEDRLIAHDVEKNLWSTPLVADPRDSGSLELIGLSWAIETDPTLYGHETPVGWQEVGWELFRLALDAPTPAQRTWAGYMGTEHDGRYMQRMDPR